MYGTVARFRIKPGMDQKLDELSREFSKVNVPGLVAEYVYRMDKEESVYYLAVVFDSRESYFANANSPEQDARYRQLAELFVGEPEWHDGQIVFSDVRPRATGTEEFYSTRPFDQSNAFLYGDPTFED